MVRNQVEIRSEKVCNQVVKPKARAKKLETKGQAELRNWNQEAWRQEEIKTGPGIQDQDTGSKESGQGVEDEGRRCE